MGKYLFSHGTNHSKGTAILIKKDFEIKVLSKEVSADGRYVSLKTRMDNTCFRLLNVYFPNEESNQLQFLNILQDKIKQSQEAEIPEKIIIGGDFNCPVDMKVDKQGGNMDNNYIMGMREREEIKQVMRKYDLEEKIPS